MRPLFSLGTLPHAPLLLTGMLVFAPGLAQAHLPHQTPSPFPFRCPQQGICLQSTGDASLFGGVRQEDSELRFHAVHKSDIASETSEGQGDEDGAQHASDGNDKASEQSEKKPKLTLAEAKDRNKNKKEKKDPDSKDDWCVLFTMLAGDKIVAESGDGECESIDLEDGRLFGIKPTAEDADERNLSGLVEGSQEAFLQHILNAQPSVEHSAAWRQVVRLARETLASKSPSKAEDTVEGAAAEGDSDASDSAAQGSESAGEA